ncbi:hypothetical protein BV898_07380 [Hypsibius exemplaris]|uniref:Uncharacterized protein n=1 Tax=Hypsibius exemplaris TaxID=2072580 RepID=A0A1W0WTM2_HYPEX|nr:hypothetical protein BV898_07380 [Hypsibius exemplaris]
MWTSVLFPSALGAVFAFGRFQLVLSTIPDQFFENQIAPISAFRTVAPNRAVFGRHRRDIQDRNRLTEVEPTTRSSSVFEQLVEAEGANNQRSPVTGKQDGCSDTDDQRGLQAMRRDEAAELYQTRTRTVTVRRRSTTVRKRTTADGGLASWQASRLYASGGMGAPQPVIYGF